MQDLIIQIDTADPVEILGPNNANLAIIRKAFPKLKIIARGNIIQVLGTDRELKRFEKCFKRLIEHFNKFNILEAVDVEQIISNGDSDKEIRANGNGDVLVYGRFGMVVRAKTAGQERMVEACAKNDMVFAVGPAGTGKTYTAVALAVKALKEQMVRRIILTRPAVEAGENLGFLPGDLKEKLDPYLQPLYDALGDMIPGEKLADLVEAGTIQIAPLGFMRGRTLDHAFVILDEAQNATQRQMKMFLTRMGSNAKFIINGDITQIDLPARQPSGLVQALEYLSRLKGIAMIFLDESDVIRHRLVKQIIKSYENAEDDNQQNDD